MEVSSTEDPLHEHGAEFAGGCGNAVAGAPVAGGEDFGRNDELKIIGLS